MQGNDLSNSTYGTVMVHIDVLLKDIEVPRKLRKPKTVKQLDLLQCNRLHLAVQNIWPSLECFNTDGSDLSQWENELDRLGFEIFNWFMPYDSVEQVTSGMAYRPRLIGVVDIPARSLRYGSRFIPFDQLVHN